MSKRRRKRARQNPQPGPAASAEEPIANEPIADEPIADEPIADETDLAPAADAAPGAIVEAAGVEPSADAEAPDRSAEDERPADPAEAAGPSDAGADVAELEAGSDQAAGGEAVEGVTAAEDLPGPEAPPETAEADDGSVLPPAQIRAALEALIFASPHPITPREIARVLEGVRKEDWQRELAALRADYARDERGLQVIEVAAGYQITTRPEYNDWVRELLDPRTPTRLSIQALETLAVIAYKQPVTLPEIIELRGVKSGGVVKTLLEKRLIRITGRKEVVGRPILYGTTKQFLLHFGLKDLNELPRIEEFAEVLGEEVDVAGLKRAIESPLPVQVGLSDPDGEQIPLFEGADPAPAGAGASEDGEEPLPSDAPPNGELFAPADEDVDPGANGGADAEANGGAVAPAETAGAGEVGAEASGAEHGEGADATGTAGHRPSE